MMAIYEALVKRSYQICLVDPEGDYDNLPESFPVGDEKQPASLDLILQALKKPDSQVVANLLGLPLPDRPAFFANALPRIQEMRMLTGRPHWLVVDEAHHLLPAEWAPASAELASELRELILITVHPDHVAPAALQSVDVMFAVGPAPEKLIRSFARATGVTAPEIPKDTREFASNEVLAWFRESNRVRRVEYIVPSAERKRHKRKYAHGELGEDKSFYFRGVNGQLNLRAQNLVLFLQLAEGVDDETWMFHLRKGDYSTWVRQAIKDSELADELARIESDPALDALTSRQKIKKSIEQKYTAPA